MNHPVQLKSTHKIARLALLLSVLCAHPVSAQMVTLTERHQAPGGPFGRVFYGNYTPPAIRGFDTRVQDSLESMIKDNKLQLAEADVVRLALENNVDIKVERYTPYFNLWGIDKGRAVLNPAILFNSNVNRLVTPAASVLQGGDTLLNLNTTYDLTIHKPFEKGLDLEVNFRSGRARTSSFFFSFNPSFTSTLGLSVTQHLLKDFGGVSRGRFLRIARNSYSMSREDFISRATTIVANVLNVYWDLVFNEEDIRVKEASKKLAEVVLEQNKIQAEVGTMSPLDVVQAEAEVAGRNEQLVVARYNKRLAEDQLKKLISSLLDPGVITAAVEPVSKPLVPEASSGDLTQAIQRALELRPEVKQLRLDLENRKIQADYTRNQLLPTLDLVASYSQNGLGGLRVLRDYSKGFFDAPVIGSEEGGFWDSLDGLFSRRYLSYSVGFTLRIPLGNDEARANNAQAQISYKQGEEGLRSLQQRIALEVRDANEAMAMNRARVEAAEVTVRFAEKRLQGEQDKYSLGATTTRFILEAQRDLAEAQSRLLKSKIDLIKSRIAFEKAVGDIFSAYNIEVKDVLPLIR